MFWNLFCSNVMRRDRSLVAACLNLLMAKLACSIPTVSLGREDICSKM
jgi:hypothetical protein